MAVQGFFIATKSLGCDNLPLDPREINKAMRCGDKTISEKKIQAWLETYSSLLYWKNDESYYTRKTSYAMTIEESSKIPTLYPHEFLFLVCNAIDRLHYVFTFLQLTVQITHMKLHQQMNIKQESLRVHAHFSLRIEMLGSHGRTAYPSAMWHDR